MNQYSQEDAAKTAGISGSLILNPLPGLDVAAVAGLIFCWTRQNNLLLLLHIRK